MQKLLARKNHVVATTRVPSEASALQQLVKEHPDGALRITALDTSEPSSISAWASALKEQGPRHIDVSMGSSHALYEYLHACFSFTHQLRAPC